MTKAIPQGFKFWKGLANGLPETNGKRGGLGSKCGRGRRPFPFINKKKHPSPFSMGVFLSRALFLQMLQAIQQEAASASEALSTNAIHQELCLRVLQLQMHLCAVLVEPGRRKSRNKGKKQEEEAEGGGGRRREEKRQGRERRRRRKKKKSKKKKKKKKKKKTKKKKKAKKKEEGGEEEEDDD